MATFDIEEIISSFHEEAWSACKRQPTFVHELRKRDTSARQLWQTTGLRRNRTVVHVARKRKQHFQLTRIVRAGRQVDVARQVGIDVECVARDKKFSRMQALIEKLGPQD